MRLSQEERSRAPVAHFERLYAKSPDPWGYETSAYERAKYGQTLAYLPEETGRTLELGCSIGVLTEALAPRCESLVAVDFSPRAVALAGRRLSGRTGVRVLRRVLPEEMPVGPFDTILCSELLYYWSPELVREGIARIEGALAPGGKLVAIHWRGADDRRELTGDDVHSILRRETALHWEAGVATRDYLLDRWAS